MILGGRWSRKRNANARTGSFGKSKGETPRRQPATQPTVTEFPSRLSNKQQGGRVRSPGWRLVCLCLDSPSRPFMQSSTLRVSQRLKIPASIPPMHLRPLSATCRGAQGPPRLRAPITSHISSARLSADAPSSLVSFLPLSQPACGSCKLLHG